MKALSFHLSLPCLDVEQTKDFYVDKLGAALGRKANQWLDINLFGNQITFTQSGNFNFDFKSYKFENHILPSFHFGVIVDSKIFQGLKDRAAETNLKVYAEAEFLHSKPGEHEIIMITDPNGYHIEFKCFNNEGEVFAH